MPLYRVYETLGQRGGPHDDYERHPAFEAETATEALQEFIDFDAEIETNEADDTAWASYPDHEEMGDDPQAYKVYGREHMLCADRHPEAD